MNTTTETFYVICKKGDRTKIMVYPGEEITFTNDINEAYTTRNPNKLFYMLDEYSERFKGEWEVVGVTVTTTVEHKVFDATKELEAFTNTLKSVEATIDQLGLGR